MVPDAMDAFFGCPLGSVQYIIAKWLNHLQSSESVRVEEKRMHKKKRIERETLLRK